jgi:hypothetical protein
MHRQTAYPQFFVPRLPQRLVRGRAIQLGVLHAEMAGQQRPDERAYEAANARYHCQSQLRRFSGGAVWFQSSSGFWLALGGRRRRRGCLIGLVSVRHGHPLVLK